MRHRSSYKVLDTQCGNARDVFYRIFGRDNMNLLWQLKEILGNLTVRHILDAGNGMRVSKNICLPNCAETALIVDPDGRALQECIEYYEDDRIEGYKDSIESADLGTTHFDLVYFIMSLPWTDDPEAALRRAALKSPEHIVISNAEFSSEQLGKIPSCLPEHGTELREIIEKYHALSLDIDDVMQSCGYYPLLVFHSPSWRPTPEHESRTVLYTREEPDRVPYEQARYIVQVNGKCTNNCPSCYIVKNDETMDTSIFKNIIENMKENEMICLRGGEPPLSENLIEDFIRPALDRGIHVILESNGSFIGSTRYNEYMELLTHKNIEVRLSLDREHYDFFPPSIQRARIGWISRFMEDAIRRKIKFGLFTLGMSMEEVSRFLEEFSVEPWLKYIRPLTKYSNISDLPIKGQYVDLKGTIHDSMSGEFIKRSAYGSYEDMVVDGADSIAIDLSRPDSMAE